MEIKDLYNIFLRCGSIATDSRKIGGGELFFALKGENFDGNEYAAKALDAGAAYAVVNAGAAICADADKYLDDNGMSRVIPVPDTLAALQALARFHRENAGVENAPGSARDGFAAGSSIQDGNAEASAGRLPVIGITGTNGKTTTKELIRTVLAVEYKVAATEGNLNNDIGVPLSVLKIKPDTQIAIIEMGASHLDDIQKLVRVSAPDYGIITNVGKAHLLGFGSFDGVKKAKGALYDWICGREQSPAHLGEIAFDHCSGKSVFVNEDDAVLREMASEREGLSIVPYGLETEGASVLPCTPEHPYLRIRLNDGKVVETMLIGSYNAPNVMAALCIGRFFGVPEDKAVAAIASYVPSNSRSQMIRTGHNTVIADAYNANPSSMAAALSNFEAIQAEHKTVLLGDMRELGEDSVKEHVAVVKRVLGAGFGHVAFVGQEFRKALLEAGVDVADVPCSCELPAGPVSWFDSSDALAAYLKDHRIDGCTILLKGSRGVHMEKVLPYLQ